MSERPTPETDHCISDRRCIHNINGFVVLELVNANLARKLERERDEVRETCERYRLEANAMMLQRDEAREVLAEISLYLSVGMGDQSTTAKQYHDRILEGIKMLTNPLLENWKEAQKEAEYYRERYEEMKQ